jgi:hypothetical protein
MKGSASQRRKLVLLSAVAAGVLFAAAAQAGVRGHDARPHRGAQTISAKRALAQQRVLSVLAHEWNPNRIAALVDPHTRLVRDDTLVSCHGRKGSPAAARAGRFTCLVRPRDPRSKARLWLSYRTLARGRYRLHWLRYVAG